MRSFVSLIILLILYTSVYAQDSPRDSLNTELKKNAVFITGGTLLFMGAVNINYERKVHNNQSDNLSLWLKTGYGFYYHYDVGSPLLNFRIGLTMIKGAYDKHFELSLGYMNFHGKATRWYDSFHLIYGNHALAGSIGYRYQKPDGKFIFRTGLGYPETLYVSVGFCFGK